MKHTDEQLYAEVQRRNPRAEGEPIADWIERCLNLLRSAREFKAAEAQRDGEDMP